MSFSKLAMQEMIDNTPDKACCRKALALGILFDVEADGEGVYTDTADPDLAKYFADVIARRLSIEPTLMPIKKVGREYTRVEIRSKKLAESVEMLDSDGGAISKYTEFKCSACRACFLRGIFAARGSFTFKEGNNHLELRIQHSKRAEMLRDLLAACGVEPKSVSRRNAVGLYYKKSDKIEDFFNLLQLKSTLFVLMNARIEREIAMDVNRAVNCESANIQKSVESSQEQIKLLEFLNAEGVLDRVDPDLRKTAMLRLENHSLSLAELAALHGDKSITKNTVSRRINKLTELAKRLAEEKKNTSD